MEKYEVDSVVMEEINEYMRKMRIERKETAKQSPRGADGDKIESKPAANTSLQCEKSIDVPLENLSVTNSSRSNRSSVQSRVSVKELMKSRCKLTAKLNSSIRDIEATLIKEDHKDKKSKKKHEKKCNCLETQSTQTNDKELTITLEDMVQTHVVNPMLKKLFQNYAETMNGEITLMNELDSLPSKVNALYKKSYFKTT